MVTTPPPTGPRADPSLPRRAGSVARRAGVGVASVVGTAGRRATAATRGGIERLLDIGGEGFRHLALAHATSTAGDTLVTVALAGTLFFSVPTTEARGNVGLYLLLTVAPFTVIGPLLGRVLDRHASATRAALIASAALRAVVAVVLALSLDRWWLFPTAFAFLVLSRTHGIARNALLPTALERRDALVAANGRLAWIGVLAGTAAAAVGATVTWLAGPIAGLVLAAGAFGSAVLHARLLPRLDPVIPPRTEHRVTLSTNVRLALLATAMLRLVNGFLLLLLAFAFRELDAPALDFGAVLAAAGGGFALASVTAPWLARRLRERPMVVAALAVEAAAAFTAGQVFGLVAAAALAAAAGFAWGTGKLAFDGLLQSSVPLAERGAAFTRTETVLQLAWVAGALVPTVLVLPPRVGLPIAGMAALAAQVVYVSRLLDDMRP